MPGGDGTGPDGTYQNCELQDQNYQPSMYGQGRGRGFGRGRGRGRGRGMGRGFGRGYRRGFNRDQMSDDLGVISGLQKKFDSLLEQLKGLEQRLADLGKK